MLPLTSLEEESSCDYSTSVPHSECPPLLHVLCAFFFPVFPCPSHCHGPSLAKNAMKRNSSASFPPLPLALSLLPAAHPAGYNQTARPLASTLSGDQRTTRAVHRQQATTLPRPRSSAHRGPGCLGLVGDSRVSLYRSDPGFSPSPVLWCHSLALSLKSLGSPLPLLQQLLLASKHLRSKEEKKRSQVLG